MLSGSSTIPHYLKWNKLVLRIRLSTPAVRCLVFDNHFANASVILVGYIKLLQWKGGIRPMVWVYNYIGLTDELQRKASIPVSWIDSTGSLFVATSQQDEDHTASRWSKLSGKPSVFIPTCAGCRPPTETIRQSAGATRLDLLSTRNEKQRTQPRSNVICWYTAHRYLPRTKRHEVSLSWYGNTSQNYGASPAIVGSHLPPDTGERALP